MHCLNRFRHNGSGRPAAVLPRHPLIVVSRPIRPRRQPTPRRNLRRILARKPSAPGLHAKPAPWRDRQPATADRQLCSSHKNGQGRSTDLGRRLNSLCLQLLPATTGRHGRRMRVSVSTPHSRACWMRSDHRAIHPRFTGGPQAAVGAHDGHRGERHGGVRQTPRNTGVAVPGRRCGARGGRRLVGIPPAGGKRLILRRRCPPGPVAARRRFVCRCSLNVALTWGGPVAKTASTAGSVAMRTACADAVGAAVSARTATASPPRGGASPYT